MNIPTTSTTLLRDIASSAENARWGEFVALYEPMMKAYLQSHFPGLEADDIIQNTLLALMKALPEYHHQAGEKENFHNYLTGILRHKHSMPSVNNNVTISYRTQSAVGRSFHRPPNPASHPPNRNIVIGANQSTKSSCRSSWTTKM